MKEEKLKKGGLGKIVLVVALLAVLGLIAGGYLLYFSVTSIPAAPGEEFIEEFTEEDILEANELVFSALAAEGIEEAVVDIDGSTAWVVYDLPVGMSKEVSWFFVMGAVAGASDVSQISLQAFDNDKPTEVVSVNAADIKALVEGDLSEEDFSARLVIEQPA